MRSAAALLLLLAAAARAAGFRFEGDLPASPHVLLDLTAEQLRGIARIAGEGPRWPLPEIQLSPAQRQALKESTGSEVRWLFVARREWLSGDCSCGTHNLGVLAGKRLAVLLMDLGDHLGSVELAELERTLVSPKLRGAADSPAPAAGVRWHVPGDGAPDAVPAAVARLLDGEFSRRLRLDGGWKAQRVRLPAIPRLDPEGTFHAAPLRRLASVSTRPAPGAEIAWGSLGARLDAGESVFVVVPGYAEGELGPRARAWFVLEYRRGRLASVAVRGEWGWAGSRFEGPAGDPG